MTTRQAMSALRSQSSDPDTSALFATKNSRTQSQWRLLQREATAKVKEVSSPNSSASCDVCAGCETSTGLAGLAGLAELTSLDSVEASTELTELAESEEGLACLVRAM